MVARTWHLGDTRQSLVLASWNDRLPEVIYWGPALPANTSLPTLAEASVMDVTGGMVDQNASISLNPEASQTFPGHSGLQARKQSGDNLAPSFRFLDELQSDDALTLVFLDKILDLTLTFDLALHPDTSLLTLQSRLKSSHDIQVDWLAAPVLPVPSHTDEMIEFSGRWCAEFLTRRHPFAPGARVRDNRTGRTDHAHFPGLVVCNKATRNTSGDVFAFHYGWSGGHKMVVEELTDGRRQIQFGHASRSLPIGRSFQSAPLYATYSGNGLNGAATRFQRHVRDHIVRQARKPHPVHYNCWEAVYFDHEPSELMSIASRAAELGAERFVLDDGWFGRRNDDTSSLGDWFVDQRKYPDGLTPLIEHVRSLNMEFGIWLEPEMVNEDSELFRKHPDWVLGPIQQIRGRQQLVLNMAREDVQKYLYDCTADLVNAYDIDYIKWDHNRVLPLVDALQTDGLYALLDRLRTDFPMVEIESCASGGGRIDYGILERTQRIWLSDSNDALERQRIQHDAALFLPASVTGSHVGPRTCHTSGRVFDIDFRAWTAAQRHMGFEMDPRELTDDEAATLKTVTSWWKENRGWMMDADILRLDSSDPAVLAEQQLSRTKDRFVVFSALMRPSDQILPRPLRLTGLDPVAEYQISLKNRADVSSLSRGNPAIKYKSLALNGQYLMSHGMTFPWCHPETVWVVEGRKL